ncbi:Minichromosome maintenance family protein isoform 1 [Gossypium australe]|uniref:Minichromosome maintenance family protein isoform 1 n=1 Tax=Gossypium australe TaxID=47621 RepID=A0A5B6V970_9ROSI|nr:Minichromosome maintenance family protein isoform 1 [Gossypium australe]
MLSPSLSQSEAIDTIIVSQANFKCIIIPPYSGPIDGKDSDVKLLCVVGDILKKTKNKVLVGDKVVVGSIKLVERRGVINIMFKQSSKILDPPVANVDHVLLLFTME